MEVMIAVSIFVVVMGFVLTTLVNTFRSTHQAQETSRQQQEIRFLFFRMGKEINSITKLEPPKVSLSAKENSFFLPLPKQMP